jgi:hypothetical protein
VVDVGLALGRVLMVELEELVFQLEERGDVGFESGLFLLVVI